MSQRNINRRRFLGNSTASLGAAHLPSVMFTETTAAEPPTSSVPQRKGLTGAPECYTSEWQRTTPDYAVYLPKEPGQRDEYADHIHVFHTPGGDLMCLWTQATYESAPDMRVVYSRSSDRGRTWSPLGVIDESKYKNMTSALGFPLVSRSGRIYCLYNQHPGYGDGGLFCAPLRVKYSDDDGRTWIAGGVDIPWRRTRFDHPDPGISPTGVVWQQPIRDARDRMIVGFTRWSSQMAYPRPVGGNRSVPSVSLQKSNPRPPEITAWLRSRESSCCRTDDCS